MRKSAKESSRCTDKSSCERWFLSRQKSTYGVLRDVKISARKVGACGGRDWHGLLPGRCADRRCLTQYSTEKVRVKSTSFFDGGGCAFNPLARRDVERVSMVMNELGR